MSLGVAALCTGASSYGAAAERLIGPLGGTLVRWALIVLLFGSLVRPGINSSSPKTLTHQPHTPNGSTCPTDWRDVRLGGGISG